MEGENVAGRVDMRRRLAPAVGIVMWCYASTAVAFIDPPELIPAAPEVGDVVSVSIRHGICDGFYAEPPLITRDGNALHMLLHTSHDADPLWCNNPIFTAVFELGQFPVGNYTLHVERWYDTLLPEPVFETLGNMAFSVRGQPPVALSAWDRLGGVFLVSGLVLLVAVNRRRLSDASRA